VATGVGLDARVHADPEQLLISSIVARLRQGGQIEGEVALESQVVDSEGDAEPIQTVCAGDVLGWSWLFQPY